MPTILVVLVAMSGFAACFAVVNLLTWHRDEPDHSARYFGFLCLGFAAYTALQASIFTATDLSSASLRLRWQGAASACIWVALVRFGAAFGHRRLDRFDRFCIVVYASLGVWSLASRSGYWFSYLTALEAMPSEHGLLFQPRGPFAWTYYVSIAVQYPLLARLALDGRRVVKLGLRADGAIWAACMCALLVGATHDHLVDYGALRPPYLGEYIFPMAVLAMGTRYAQRRSREFARLRQLQEALERSEARLRGLFESSSDAIFIHDAATGAILDVNRTMCEMYGYSRDQCRTLTASDLSAEHAGYTMARAGERLEEALRLGQTTFPWLARRKDRSVFPVQVTLKRTELNGRSCIVANVRDQTELETTVAALRQEKSFVDALLDGLPGAFCLCDRTLRLKRWNRNLEQSLGYKSQQLETMRMSDWYPPEERDGLVAELVAWLESERQNLERESRIVREDGSRVTHWLTATKLGTSENELFMAVGIDISALAQAQADLQEGEERYRTLFDAASDAILLLRDDKFVECNDSALTIYGCERREQLVGHSPAEFSPDSQPDDKTSVAEALQRIAAAQAGAPQRFEWLHRRADGRPFLAEVALNRVDLRGVPHVQAIVRDVTEKRRLEDRLRQAQRLEAIGHLAGGVAHDFNNLLTPIVGYAELIQDALPESHPAREDIAQVLSAAALARRLTQQLLSVGRRGVLEVRPIDLSPLVLSMRGLLQRLLREDIELELVAESDGVIVEADPSQFEQVVLNLVANARDAMPRGGRLRITVARQELDAASCVALEDCAPGAYAVVSVSDTGLGMTEEVQRRLFEPFFTTKAVGRGTGLGLATVLGVVRQHRGALTVTSEPNVGSTLNVYLPLTHQQLPFEGPASSTDRPRKGTERVLVVEDDDSVRAFTCRALERHGYRVTAASSAEQALESVALMAEPPRLVLSDVVLPKMSGRELCDRLRDQWRELRVLYMSGYSGDTISHHGILDEGVTLIQKPFSIDQLLAKVRSVLDS